MLVYHPTVLGFGKSGFFTRNPRTPTGANTRWRGSHTFRSRSCPSGIPSQNTGDARPLFRAAFDNLARWTHARHRRKPPAARLLQGWRGRDRRFHPDDGWRRPFCGRRSTPSRRLGGLRPHCRRATRQAHAAESSRTGPVPRVHFPGRDLHPVHATRSFSLDTLRGTSTSGGSGARPVIWRPGATSPMTTEGLSSGRPKKSLCRLRSLHTRRSD